MSSIDFYSQYEHDDRAREARTPILILYSSWSRFYNVNVHMFLVRLRVLVIEIQALRNERISSLSGIIFRPI